MLSMLHKKMHTKFQAFWKGASLLGCGCRGLVAELIGNDRLFSHPGVKVVCALCGLPAVVDGLQVGTVQFWLVVRESVGVATCRHTHTEDVLLPLLGSPEGRPGDF